MFLIPASMRFSSGVSAVRTAPGSPPKSWSARLPSAHSTAWMALIPEDFHLELRAL
jgi:hypothetical protein